MILKVRGMSFEYSSRPVLKNITLHVSPGETVMIMGPNGVGKSTLLKCMNGILKPGGGEMLLDGRKMLSLSQKEIAGLVGYVPQRTDPGRVSVFDAILLGRRPHMGWKVTDKDLRAVDGIIQSLHLEELALRSLDEMSGGEIQKVMIARALAQEPGLLLLDEPTSSLDLKNQVEVMEILDHIVRGHGLAAVVTMHDLNTAFRFGHRFIFLKDGEIAYSLQRQDIAASVIEDIYGLKVDLVFVGDIPLVVPRSVRHSHEHSEGEHHLDHKEEPAIEKCH